MTNVVAIADRMPAVPDGTWSEDDLFDWLDAAVPTVLEAERRTNEARVKVGYCLWLLRRAAGSERVYGDKMRALAETHEVTVRTLQRWREAAEFDMELEPGVRSVQQRTLRRPGRPVAPAPDAAVEPAARPTIDNPGRVEVMQLFDPDDLGSVRDLSEVVLKIGAERWAEALTVSELDQMAGVLRAARSRRMTAAPEADAGGHVHQFSQQKSPALGVIYVCACGARKVKP